MWLSAEGPAGAPRRPRHAGRGPDLRRLRPGPSRRRAATVPLAATLGGGGAGGAGRGARCTSSAPPTFARGFGREA